MSQRESIFVGINNTEMKQSKTGIAPKPELKEVIRVTFDQAMQDVVKGSVSVQQFAQMLNYNYTQKKMELSGSIF